MAERVVVFSARPATIIEEVNVADVLPTEHDLQIKETAGFLELRAHVQNIIRAQARSIDDEMLRTLPQNPG